MSAIIRQSSACLKNQILGNACTTLVEVWPESAETSAPNETKSGRCRPTNCSDAGQHDPTIRPNASQLEPTPSIVQPNRRQGKPKLGNLGPELGGSSSLIPETILDKPPNATALTPCRAPVCKFDTPLKLGERRVLDFERRSTSAQCHE